MKSILIALLIFVFSQSAFSQEIDINKIDEFTKTRNIRSKGSTGKTWIKSDFIDTKNQLLLDLYYLKSEKITLYTLSFSVFKSALGCLSERKSKAMLLFENDSIMTLKLTSDTDCSSSVLQGSFITVSEEEYNSPTLQDTLLENVEFLKNNTAKKIRLYGTEGYIDFELKPEKRDIISKHIRAIQSVL